MRSTTLKRALSHTAKLLGMLLVAAPVLATEAPQGDGFGRLFSAPAERQALDAHRTLPTVKRTAKKQYVKRAVAKRPTKAKPQLPLPNPITLQGYVKRSDGPNTVWINNKPVQENTTVDQVKIGRLTNRSPQRSSLIKSTQKLQHIDQLVIKIPANGKSVKLKAGQGYNAKRNKVSDITTRARQKQMPLESVNVKTEGLVK